MARLIDSAAAASVRRRLLTESRRPAAIRDSPRAAWYVVATVCIGAFMGQLDASIVTVALPHLGPGLHASVGAVEWVALIYLLVLVATVAALGHLADLVGRKLLYVYGFVVFTLASAFCGLAPTLGLLIVFRAVQALGAAMLQANSVALIAEAMPGRSLARGIGVQGTAQALGLALGPAAGGALIALGGWRLIFFVNVPAGVAGIVLGWLLLPRSRSRRPRDDASDATGATLLAVAVGALLIFLSFESHATHASPKEFGTLLAFLVSATVFVRHERRHPSPLIDFRLLRRRALSAGLVTALISYLLLFGVLLVVPFYLAARGVGSLEAGLELATLPAAIAVAAPLVGRQVSRHGATWFTSGGLLLLGLGLGEIALRHDDLGLMLGLGLAGLGLGAVVPANNAAVMGAAPAQRTGAISGVLNMTRGLGTAFGVAITSVLYTAAAGISGTNAVSTGANAAGRGLTIAVAVLAALAVATGLALLLDASRGPADARGGEAAA